jgi:hypothetical protein
MYNKIINIYYKLFLLFNLFHNIFSINFQIINNCNILLNIYSHENQKFNNICNLESNNECFINYDQISSGLIKTTLTEIATLFEFSINSNGIWYDISVIPPGSGNCYSYQECLSISNKISYNIPLSIEINNNNKLNSCQNLYCNKQDCSDAYLYPFDDLKTKFCDLNSEFKLIYCYDNIKLNNNTNDLNNNNTNDLNNDCNFL